MTTNIIMPITNGANISPAAIIKTTPKHISTTPIAFIKANIKSIPNYLLPSLFNIPNNSFMNKCFFYYEFHYLMFSLALWLSYHNFLYFSTFILFFFIFALYHFNILQFYLTFPPSPPPLTFKIKHFYIKIVCLLPFI